MHLFWNINVTTAHVQAGIWSVVASASLLIHSTITGHSSSVVSTWARSPLGQGLSLWSFTLHTAPWGCVKCREQISPFYWDVLFSVFQVCLKYLPLWGITGGLPALTPLWGFISPPHLPLTTGRAIVWETSEFNEPLPKLDFSCCMNQVPNI